MAKGRKTGGRKKGTPNKFTGTRQQIAAAKREELETVFKSGLPHLKAFLEDPTSWKTHPTECCRFMLSGVAEYLIPKLARENPDAAAQVSGQALMPTSRRELQDYISAERAASDYLMLMNGELPPPAPDRPQLVASDPLPAPEPAAIDPLEEDRTGLCPVEPNGARLRYQDMAAATDRDVRVIPRQPEPRPKSLAQEVAEAQAAVIPRAPAPPIPTQRRSALDDAFEQSARWANHDASGGMFGGVSVASLFGPAYFIEGQPRELALRGKAAP